MLGGDIADGNVEVSLGDLSLGEFAEDEVLPGLDVDEDENSSLPSQLLPGFWPCFFLAATLAGHILFLFMSVWYATPAPPYSAFFS